MTIESTGSPDAGHELPSVDEVIDSARDLSGVERPILPPDRATTSPIVGSPVGAQMADAGHGAPATGTNGNGNVSGHGASPLHGTPTNHGPASGHASAAPDSHAGGHDDGHGAHDPRDTNLGPPDLASWSAGIIGVVIALVVAICFALATGVLAT